MVFNDIYNLTKKNIDTTLLMLGREIILPNESLIFYHSTPQKFEIINNLGNWFSPIKIKEKQNYYHANNIFIHDKPLWDNGYDFRFINKKPLKLLLIKSYTNDITSNKLKNMIDIINYNIAFQKQDLEKQDLENTAFQKSRAKTAFDKIEIEDGFVKDNEEYRSFLLGQENDPEYLLAYYLCKYSSFDGWITDASYLGFCMLRKECLKKLKLISISQPPNSDNVIMYYTYNQWKEQFI